MDVDERRETSETNTLQSFVDGKIWRKQCYYLRIELFEFSENIVEDNMDRLKYLSIVANHVHPYIQIAFPGHEDIF